MTANARLVLEDCRQELLDFQKQLPPSVWRRRWTTVIVLLRAVGHVLQKVDGKVDDEHRSALQLALHREIAAWWSELKGDKSAHPLFWEFIERERNSFIKAYDTSARQVVAIQVGAVNYDAKRDRQWSDPPNPTYYLEVMRSGYYDGRNLRDVAHEAVRWWEEQLDGIDLRVKNDV